ncbi:MAG TPA: tetratricopeptide repeat protein [Bryobacteraceae bacterium]|nr:tetratricopeptide repeat protein [Bryobacteraceae bacterium]
MTGSMAHFEAVNAAIREALDEFGPREDVCLLKANLDFRFHRLAEVRQDLQMCPLLSGRFEGRVVLADLDFQEGRYETARLKLERLVAENRTWDNLARLAHWRSKLGDVAEADELYDEAEDDLTSKQMRSYAWLELQRGVLALTHGRYVDARKHYQRADEAYPGHWHTDEHFAELLAAEGKFDEAAALFRDVIARCPKPELQQALGELCVFCGRPEAAGPWFDSALAAYLESVERGGVHYFHHLADFYADAREEPAKAVRWARRDLEMRSNFSTQAALAWALYRDGQLPKATEYIRMALSSGVQDAGIFSTAASLFEAAGETAESQRYAEAALQINPKHQNFHMHH